MVYPPATVRLYLSRRDPGGGAAPIACTLGWDVPVSGASHGRQVRANQQGDPPHTSALRPVWHTDLAPLVCPGPCSVPPDRWSQVHSEVVTTDVPALVPQHDGPAQMGQGLHGAESFSTTETAAELVQGRPEAETPKSRAGRPTVACWVSIFLISGIPGNPRCCHGRDAEGPDSPARHSSIRAAAISRHADRARSGHAHGSGGRGCERQLHLVQLAECPGLGEDREQRRFAQVRIVERRETISSAKPACGVLENKESDDTRRSR